MCRLLAVRSDSPFSIGPHLEKFAHIARHSREYQGHGWGCAYLDEGGRWRIYRNIRPVWEEDFSRFPSTTLLVSHARSAFEDRDIRVENNMPFFDGRTVFVFNGELRGVRIREEGRIGAEKLYNYIKRFDKGSTEEALARAVEIIKKRTTRLRAMNIIMVNEQGIHVSSFFNEDGDYFTMRCKEGRELIICSEPYPAEKDWHLISNDSIRVW